MKTRELDPGEPWTGEHIRAALKKRMDRLRKGPPTPLPAGLAKLKVSVTSGPARGLLSTGQTLEEHIKEVARRGDDPYGYISIPDLLSWVNYELEGDTDEN